MEIKTYVAGLENGLESAFKRLDQLVKDDLGNRVEIHYIGDSLCESESHKKVARVVVYKCKPIPDGPLFDMGTR